MVPCFSRSVHCRREPGDVALALTPEGKKSEPLAVSESVRPQLPLPESESCLPGRMLPSANSKTVLDGALMVQAWSPAFSFVRSPVSGRKPSFPPRALPVFGITEPLPQVLEF